MTKWFIILFIAVSCLAFTYYKLNNDNMSYNSAKDPEELFEKINLETTLKETIDLLGNDYIDVGSGLHILIYSYDDNYAIEIRGGFLGRMEDKIR